MVSILRGSDFETAGSVEAFADALADDPIADVLDDGAESEVDALAANDDGARDWSHLALARWFCGAEVVPRKTTRTGSHPIVAAAQLLQQRVQRSKQ